MRLVKLGGLKMSLINYELKPTTDNLKKSILTDMVGRNKAIVHFVKFLDATEGNIAVALDDSWGNGKTFFVKQTQMVLQSYHSSDDKLTDVKNCMSKIFENHIPKNYFPIYYDAWTNDNDTDPILSIIFTMLQDLACLQKYEVNDKNFWDSIKAGFEIISTTLGGPRIKNFLDSIEGKNILDELKKRKEIDQVLNEMFDTALQNSPEGTRIIFFVDELDRCCPDFAVRLLERIKHYFLNEKVVFVFSINALELQHTIQRHYGNNFNADKYLRRFFDFTIPLPVADMQKYYEIVKLDVGTTINDIVLRVIRKYNFSMREITRYVQHLRIAIPQKYNSFYPRYGFYLNMLIPFLIGLKVHDTQKFNDFTHGEGCQDFIEVMQEDRLNAYCQIFLNNDETFEVGHIDKKLMSFADKFRPAYRLLFGKNNPELIRPVTVSGDTIIASDKNFILDTVSLMKAEQNLKNSEVTQNGTD